MFNKEMIVSVKGFNSDQSEFSLLRAKVMFDNGFGASIITGTYTQSSECLPYEVAVIDSKGNIRYNTPIADDVIGYLTEDEVKKILFQISGLIPDSMQLINQ